jgi:choloylglycine hydrolase
MCTAVDFIAHGRYFGRNLDLEHSFGECVTVTPRNFTFKFKHLPPEKSHYAMIGMALVKDTFPLYFDAVNEFGIGMAGLNFPGNAGFPKRGMVHDTVAQFELIPYVLGRCKTLSEVRETLKRVNFSELPFSRELPVAELHYMVSDAHRSLTVEPTKAGLYIYENPFGVLTNNPPFPFHKENINNYMNLTRKPAKNRLSQNLPLKAYSRGMGAMGLPGDFSSASRFVRATFVKHCSARASSEEDSVNQFFHILSSVAMPDGCVETADGFEHTQYSCCCNLDTGTYYYKTYSNSRIGAVSMKRENLDGKELIFFPLRTNEDIFYEN